MPNTGMLLLIAVSCKKGNVVSISRFTGKRKAGSLVYRRAFECKGGLRQLYSSNCLTDKLGILVGKQHHKRGLMRQGFDDVAPILDKSRS